MVTLGPLFVTFPVSGEMTLFREFPEFPGNDGKVGLETAVSGPTFPQFPDVSGGPETSRKRPGITPPVWG